MSKSCQHLSFFLWQAPLFGTKQGKKATLKHLQRVQKLLDVKEAKMDWVRISSSPLA